MPAVEPLVAGYLQPQPRLSWSISLPSDRFQSALTEKAYKAALLSAKALNVLSLLTAYQAVLCEDFGQTQDTAVQEEILIVSDLCLHIQRHRKSDADSGPSAANSLAVSR